MTAPVARRACKLARTLGRSLVAAFAVEGGVLAIASGYSSAVCDSDKLAWSLMLAVFPLMSPYVLAFWLAAVALATFALPALTSRFGGLRTLVGVGAAWVAIFGSAWALSAGLAHPGCSVLG